MASVRTRYTATGLVSAVIRYDGCQKPNEKNQYSSLDRANLMRDGLLEIDMVLSGLSVVSHVGFQQKNLEVQI